MAGPYFSNLKDELGLPDAFEGIATSLDDLFANLASHGIAITFANPEIPPDDNPDPGVQGDPELGNSEEISEGDVPPNTEDPSEPPPETAAPESGATRLLTIELEALSEIEVGLPGLDAVKIVINPAPFQVGASINRVDGVLIEARLGVAVRFDRKLLVPMRAVSDGKFEEDPDAPSVDIIVAEAIVRATGAGGLDLDFGAGLTLTRPAMIGQTGVIIESADLAFNFDGSGPRPDGAPEGWKGVLFEQASIRIPAVFDGAITAERLGFGSGGVTGTVARTFPVDLSGTVLGMSGGVTEVALTFRENILTQCAITARVLIPFFDEDNPVDLLITIGTDGTVTATLAGSLVTLERDGIVRFDVTSITFGIEDGEAFTAMSGIMRPLVADLEWPGFEIQDLRIDANGNVTFAGGWIDLPSQVTLNLFGFLFEITRIGFGKTEEQRHWIGFNGSLRMLEGVPAGASVEGLRIIWGGPEANPPPVHLTMEGVGVDLEVPGVIKFAGKVSFREREVNGLTAREFAGAVTVVLPAISFECEGQFVAGKVPGTDVTSYGVFLQMQLPAGIPLGPTGLAFYGLAGLYAHNREPKKLPQQGWYNNPDFSPGWFTTPPIGVTDLVEKWQPAQNHMGFGAGIILGTFADNGFMFNGRLLLVLVFPGPVILIEGMANLFKQRTGLTSGPDPNFHTLVVIEPGKSFLAGLDAQYRFAGGGELLDIRGSAEAFFSFQQADPQWFIYLGVDHPTSRRIGARVFQLFDVNGYFMLKPGQLKVGAGWSYNKRFGLKRLHVRLYASMEANAVVSWNPTHFHGSVGVEGGAELCAFGICAGISVGAKISGDVFDPFKIRGEFRARLNLPWPLPDIKKTVVMQWKHEFSDPAGPRIPVPLREAAIEHLISRNTWALERNKALVSDDGGGQFEFERPGGAPAPVAPDAILPPFAAGAGIPRVPCDSKVALTFARPMHDPVFLAMNENDVDPELIGDPRRTSDAKGGAYEVGYKLVSVELQKWAPGDTAGSGALGWVTIRSGGVGSEDGRKLVGTWGLGVEDPLAGRSERHKLFINSTNPFDYTAGRSTSWEDWFVGANPDFACPLPQPSEVARFNQPLGTVLAPDPGHFEFDRPAFELQWHYGGDVTSNREVLDGLLEPIDRGLRNHDEGLLSGAPIAEIVTWVLPPAGASEVHLRFGTPPIFKHTGIGAMSPETTTPSRPAFMEQFVAIAAFDSDGPIPHPVGGTLHGRPGMIIESGVTVEFTPNAPALAVELTLYGGESSPVARIQLFDSGGNPLLNPAQQIDGEDIVLRYDVEDIARVAITVESDEFVLSRLQFRTPVNAIAFSASNPTTEIGRFVEDADGFIKVQSSDMGKIFLYTPTGGDFLFLELIVPGREGEIIRHTIESLTHLNTEDPLFEPENDYRLVVTTNRDDAAVSGSEFGGVLTHNTTFIHHAYFHVVGPPGIETPDQPPAPNPESIGQTGLTDLRLYVQQTLPPVIPDQGDKLILPRAFYRGYDPVVKFNLPHTELMYLTARRSLTIRLYDGEDNPVLNAAGRVSIPIPSWERSRDATLSESVAKWVSSVNQMACHPDDLPQFDPTSVVRPQTLSGAGEDVVMAPQTMHQARLVPSLLHETFLDPLPGLIADAGNYRLERWVALGASQWEIDFETVTIPEVGPSKVFFVKEGTQATSVLLYDGPLGAVDGPDAPHNWLHFRASAVVRWETGTIGFDFRRSVTGHYIRLTLERDPGNPGTGTRRLVAHLGGFDNELASDTTSFPNGQTDLPITIECVGTRLLVFQDGELAFDLNNAPVLNGTLGLYVQGATSPRFTEIRVDDLRPTPSTAFTFDFVTSKYTNFHHHLHSFPDRMIDGAPGTALTTADLSEKVGASIAVPATGGDGLGEILDGEWRAFDALETKAFGQAALATPEGIEITRVSQTGAPTALMVRSPEPFLWERTLLEVSSTSDDVAAMDIPGDLKLTDVTFGADAAGESVTILVREKTSLASHRLEWRPLPDAGNPDPEWNTYFEFDAGEAELADGRQVRVFACAVEEGPPREPGTILRFLVTEPDTGVVHFNVPGVEVRLLAPDGETVAHQRRFPTPDAFAPFPMRAVRKLDGTAFVLFVAPGTPGPAPAALRLRFVFNRVVGEEDLRFRQGGSETQEVAVLDFSMAAAV